MFLLKKSIFDNPFILLGIILLTFGFASVLFKVFSVTKTGTNNKYGIRERNNERKYSKQVLAILLIAILIALIVLITRLSKIKYG